MNKTKLYIVFLLMLFTISKSFSQDLEPRMLSAIPTGGNFAVASYAYSRGNILLDNSLPISGLNANMNNMVYAYARSFKLLSRLAKFDVIAPYSFARFSGNVNGADSSTYRHGFGDPLLRLSIVLIGSKAMNTAEFLQSPQDKFNLGVSIRVRPPIGQYFPDKLINLGANRWATKLGLAGSYLINKKITIEAYLNTWFFTENTEFFNGNKIKQKPLISSQIHISYIFKPGVWLAVSGGKSFLGETLVNSVKKNNPQNSSRYGAVFAYRLNKNNTLKLGFTSGLSTRYGADFTTIILAYQFMWFDKNN